AGGGARAGAGWAADPTQRLPSGPVAGRRTGGGRLRDRGRYRPTCAHCAQLHRPAPAGDPPDLADVAAAGGGGGAGGRVAGGAGPTSTGDHAHRIRHTGSCSQGDPPMIMLEQVTFTYPEATSPVLV